MARVAIGDAQPTATAAVFPVDAMQRVEVQTKETWEGTWIPRPGIMPISCNWEAAPSLSTATFIHHYGERMLEGETSFSTVAPLELRDHYIRVSAYTSDDITVPINTWVGQVVIDTRDIHGRNPTDARNKQGGVQHLSAYGLEHLLKKCPIDKTHCLQNGTLVSARSPMVFNQTVSGGPMTENRTIGYVADLGEIVSMFGSGTVTTPSQWSLVDIVMYLLAWFVNDRTAPQFKLAGYPGLIETLITGVNAHFLADIYRVEDLFGLSAWDALNKLFDRRRGFGWNISTNGEGTPPQIGDDGAEVPGSSDPAIVDLHVWTLTAEPISVGDVVIPANTNQVTKRLDETVIIPKGGLQVTNNASRMYDAIEVRSAPIVSMFSVSYFDETLEAGWSAAEETAYKDAAKDASGYGSLTTKQQAVLNDRYRRTADAVGRVYLRHVIPPDFDWMVGQSAAGADQRWAVVPTTEPHGDVNPNPDASPAQLTATKRLLPWLPMQAGLDYSTSPITETTDEDAGEWIPPLVYLAYKSAPIYDLWRRVDLLGTEDQLPQASVKILKHRPGFDLELAGTLHLPHNWAWKNPRFPLHDEIWTAATVEPSMNSTLSAPNSADYRCLVATVAVETDERLRVVVNASRWGQENETTLIIDFPHIHYWVAAKYTKVGVDTLGRPNEIHEDNRVLRDDSEQLKQIAGLLRTWYSVLRRNISLTWKSFDFFEVGTMLLAIASPAQQQQFNTVITSVMWDFTGQTTRITSDFADLDFAGMFGGQVHAG